MQIVRRKDAKRALLAFADDVPLDLGNQLQAPDLLVADISAASHEIVSGPAPAKPLHFVAGALAYDEEDGWSIVDQATYDLNIDKVIEIEERLLEEMRAAMPPLSRREVKHILVEIGIAPETVEAKINEKYDALIEEAEAIEDEGARLVEIAAIEKERKHDLIDWQDAQYFERLYPLLNDLADLFDLPPEQVDALWMWGAEQ